MTQQNLHLPRILPALILLLIFQANAFALTGSGSQAYPYLIQALADFDSFASDPNYWASGIYTRLECDPNLIGRTYTTAVIAPDIDNIVGGFQGTSFIGVFDGNGHVISNFTFSSVNESYAAIFGMLSHATVSDLRVEDVIISADSYVAAIAGEADDSYINNCSSSGSIDSFDYPSGGLVGYSYQTTIINSNSTVSVIGEDTVGGLVGDNSEGSVINCYATGDVEAVGYGFAGGLAGESYGPIDGCYATGAVTVPVGHGGGLIGYSTELVTNCFATGSVTGHRQCGGLVGENRASVTRSYSTGSVTATGYEIGGLVGDNVFGDIVNCYTTSSVTGDYSVGGLIGYTYNCIVSNSYAAGVVSGTTDVGGLVGEDFNSRTVYSACFWNSDNDPNLTGIGNGSDPNVIGETTANMQIQSTFTNAGWDFTGEDVNGTNDIWRMCVDGVNYPHLFYQYSINGDFACPDGVDINDLLVLSWNWLNSKQLDPGFSYACDPTFDGLTNLADFGVLFKNW